MGRGGSRLPERLYSCGSRILFNACSQRDVGVALAILRKFNDLSCNCLSDTLVTVSGAQGYAGQLDGYTQDALSL